LRIFKIRWFQRFARKEGIKDADLCEAVDRAEQGAIDANLGGGLIKQRLARKGGGKRGGYRTIIAYRKGERAVFVYGFPKKARENVSANELDQLKRAASEALRWSDQTIEDLIAGDKWVEVYCDEQDEEA
jgi:hypothetical protein